MAKPRHHETAILIMILCLAGISIAQAQATDSSQSQTPSTSKPISGFRNMREAIQALKAAKSPSEAERVREAMANTPVRDHTDLIAVYDEARQREDETPLFASDKEFDEYVRNGQAVAARLKTSDTQFQDDIAVLIDKERESWSTVHVPMLPIGKISLRDGAKSAQRVVRVEALFSAAGESKNEKARAPLWRVVDSVHDAYFGQLAVAALGKIGNSEDLDRLIQMIEQNPKLHFQFLDFGGMAIPRLVNEIKNRNLPQETQGSLALGLREVGSHDTMSNFVPLMHDSNQFVAREAQLSVEHNLRSTDEDLINKMLRDSSYDVQAMAMNAVDGQAWDPKFIPLLLNRVKRDDPAAAECLGHHRVKSALPVLQEALKSPHGYMQRSAKAAIREINRK